MRKGLLERLIADLKSDVPNLEAAVQHVSVEAIEAAGTVQSSFAEFNSILAQASRQVFDRHSAFYIYHVDAVFLSRRALREAVCGYYGAAGSLLRSACEAILRGAFWECLAHKQYRDRAEILSKAKRKPRIDGTRRNVLDWLKQRFEAMPSLEEPLEKQSGGIFDIVSPLFENRELFRAVPSLKVIVEQLSVWKMFEPISNPMTEIYDDLYGRLSQDTHLIPGKTMMGRLMVAGKDASVLFEPSQEEFDRFFELMRQVAEIGAVALFNVVEDDARKGELPRAKIASMVKVADQIGLRSVALRIRNLSEACRDHLGA
jgi:hypothetical protein